MILDGIWLLYTAMLYSLRLGIPAGSFPKPLSAKQEKEYLALAAEGDLEARNILIERNLRLVAHIMKKYYAQGADQEDLISIGTIGLIKGISTFNPDKGVRLATYAARCIENEILMHFRSQRKSAQDISLSDDIDGGRDGSTLSLMDVLCDETDLLEDLSCQEQYQQMYAYLRKCLTAQERTVLQLRYGLGGGTPLPQRDVAEKCGISRSYVSERGYDKQRQGTVLCLASKTENRPLSLKKSLIFWTFSLVILRIS